MNRPKIHKHAFVFKGIWKHLAFVMQLNLFVEQNIQNDDITECPVCDLLMTKPECEPEIMASFKKKKKNSTLCYIIIY